MMMQAVNQVSDNQKAASQLATAFEMGDPNVGITEVMIAAQKSSVSFEALSQVRNKLVKAYEDIMNMPV
jgi:flagellar hook-basal body complex protein FliE